jgi:hypothetical protein
MRAQCVLFLSELRYMFVTVAMMGVIFPQPARPEPVEGFSCLGRASKDTKADFLGILIYFFILESNLFLY